MHDWRSLIVQRIADTPSLDPASANDVVEELMQHFEQIATELQSRGAAEAAIDARLEQELAELDPDALVMLRRLAGTEARAAEPTGAPTFSGWLDGVVRDIVVAWRSLRRTAGVTTVVVASLAIVLGANTAIFGLTDAMYLRRLDIPDPEQLVRVDALHDGRPYSVRYSEFRNLRSVQSVPKLAGLRTEPVEVTTATGDRHRLWLELVTGEYFDLVGIKPLLGRAIDAADESSAAPVVVISEDYWRQHLGARTDALGQTLHVNDELFTIVGVMPARYRGVYFAHRFEMAAPFTVSPMGFKDARVLATTILARLDGKRDRRVQQATLDAAIRACCVGDAARYSPFQARATNIRVVPVDDPPSALVPAQDEAPSGLTVRLADGSRGLPWGRDFRDRYKTALIAMAGAVLLLLLIACANVATLLLARGERRAREFAIRCSLGASIGRIRRQLFIESLELCLAGGALGLLVAWAGTTLLAHALPPSVQPLGDVIAWHASSRVLVVTLVITALCAVATSVWPARRVARDELVASLAGSHPRGLGSWASQQLLATCQISLAVVLITAAWLFVSTTRNLTRSAGGYGTRNVMLAQLDAGATADSGAARMTAIEGLRQDLLHIPGVIGVAYSLWAPLVQDGLSQLQFELPGSTARGSIVARFNKVSSDFFRVSGAGVARGREFVPSDGVRGDPVAIVSESFERRYWPGRSAVGAMITVPGGSTPKQIRIVGVARDVHYDRMAGRDANLRNPATEMIYLPFTEPGRRSRLATMIVRSAADQVTLNMPLRRAVERRAGLQLGRVTTLGSWLDDATARERFSGALATVFGVLAVMLAAIGVLGVLSYQVARRTKEIGVRMALGARRSDTVGLVMKETLGMLLMALAVGLPCAIGAAWLIRAQLYGVAPWDPRAAVAATVVIVAAGIIASLVPSYRASCVDPLVALREE